MLHIGEGLQLEVPCRASRFTAVVACCGWGAFLKCQFHQGVFSLEKVSTSVDHNSLNGNGQQTQKSENVRCKSSSSISVRSTSVGKGIESETG